MIPALLALLLSPTHSQLVQQVWPSTAFAPQSASTTTQVPSLSFTNTPFGVFPALCSVRFSGTIVSPTTQLYNFSIQSEGGVRLWVDDFLVVDSGGNHSTLTRAKSFLNLPLVAGVPKPIRVEYSRWGGTAPTNGAGSTLELWWSGNTTGDTLVPPSAFAPTLSKFLLNRNALRDRLENPVVPWQTYSMQSMAAHVLMPSGLALSATLSVLGGQGGGNATLGRIVPFRNGNPALVQPGPRSLNGSDYTLLTVSKWAPAGNATVTLESTVVNGDLVFLASCSGVSGSSGDGSSSSACDSLYLVVEPFMMAERAGVIVAGGGG